MAVAAAGLRALLTGAALGALCAAASAQTSPTAVPAPVTTAEDPTAAATTPEEAKADTIVVTGSRIARTQFDAPNPIISLNAAALQQSGQTNVTAFLTRIPALVGSEGNHDQAGSNAGFGEAGLNLLNLRNLGTNRTLVLVNGRRHVAGDPGTAAVDINTIPTDLIERVDVLTGSASAVYGADAVSGVVNFVLKSDFEGVSARGQQGISSRGDGANHFASIVAGHNFGGGRGNVTLSYEFNKNDRIQESYRRRLQSGTRYSLIRNQDDIPDDPNVPDYLYARDVRYAESAPGGAVDVNGDYVPDFTGAGLPYDLGQELIQGNGLTIGGSSTPTEGYQGDLEPSTRRHNVNLISHYDFGDALKLSVEGKYVNTRTFTISQPTFDYFTYISPDNPFAPAVIRDAAAANGADMLVTRDNFDFGTRGEVDHRQTYRGVIDASGRISDHATYDAYYEYGRTHTRTTSLHDRLGDRFAAAVDAVTDPATGLPTCRSNLDPAAAAGATTFTPGAASGCSPVNLFGFGSPSAASLAFFTVNHDTVATITQQVASGAITGDFGQFFTLPGGPVKFSIGGEYRRETSRFTPDQYLQNGEIQDTPQILPASGRFHVGEAFSELDVPILKDVRFAKALSVGAAFRYSDYSTIGKTTTWQFNGSYAPIRDITFRGTYSKAVRAPNISELFDPTSGTNAFFSDPCDVNNLNDGTGTRTANCATLLSGLGIDPATYTPTNDPQASVSIEGTSGGNRNLREETARTWTAGTVLRPGFLPNLTVAVDWYDIRLRNAINTASPQRIAELCVDQPTLDNPYCAQISRNPATGFINGFAVFPQNVAAFKTSGADFNLNYLVPTARLGTFNVRIVGNYLNTLTFVATPGADPTNEANVGGDSTSNDTQAPRWQANLAVVWTKGKLTLAYDLDWHSRTRRFSRLTTAGDPDYTARKYLFFKQRWEHDINLSYDLTEQLGLYAGVNNLIDQKAAIGVTSYPVSGIGRYLYVGARVALGRPKR